MTTLKQIVEARAAWQTERAKRQADHDAWISECAAALAHLTNTERLIILGFDPDRIQRARAIIEVRGKSTESRRGFRDSSHPLDSRNLVVEQAKAAIAEGGGRLKVEYFGVKNYEAFGDQRTDCEYGMGPRHGSIVFSIGFTREVRDRFEKGGQLTEDEINDALYLLTALPTIEKPAAERVA